MSDNSPDSHGLNDVQEYVRTRLSVDPWMIEHGVSFISEDTADIEYQVESAISKLGIVGIIATPRLTYQGYNAEGQVWRVDGLSVLISEIPTINRARANATTAATAAVRAARILGGPDIVPEAIDQEETMGIVTANATFLTTFIFTLPEYVLDEESDSSASN